MKKINQVLLASFFVSLSTMAMDQYGGYDGGGRSPVSVEGAVEEVAAEDEEVGVMLTQELMDFVSVARATVISLSQYNQGVSDTTTPVDKAGLGLSYLYGEVSSSITDLDPSDSKTPVRVVHKKLASLYIILNELELIVKQNKIN